MSVPPRHSFSDSVPSREGEVRGVLQNLLDFAKESKDLVTDA